mmetsp:Transcript_1884/g.4635  ORF Transcript_1884/g.4635 Transcript_1884/m.4635 type:complete len:206 (-) Transcript_1884:195-812(-)
MMSSSSGGYPAMPARQRSSTVPPLGPCASSCRVITDARRSALNGSKLCPASSSRHTGQLAVNTNTPSPMGYTTALRSLPTVAGLIHRQVLSPLGMLSCSQSPAPPSPRASATRPRHVRRPVNSGGPSASTRSRMREKKPSAPMTAPAVTLHSPPAASSASCSSATPSSRTSIASTLLPNCTTPSGSSSYSTSRMADQAASCSVHP